MLSLQGNLSSSGPNVISFILDVLGFFSFLFLLSFEALSHASLLLIWSVYYFLIPLMPVKLVYENHSERGFFFNILILHKGL